MADDTMQHLDRRNQAGSSMVMALIGLTGAGLLVMATEGARPWQENLFTWMGWLWAVAYGAMGIYALTDAWEPSRSGPVKRTFGRIVGLVLVAGLAANGMYLAASISAFGVIFAMGRAALAKAEVAANG